jgi:8-amino-7-oxononanoate synthase
VSYASAVEAATRSGGPAPEAELVIDAVDGIKILVEGRWALSFMMAGYLGIDHGAWLRAEGTSHSRSWGLALASPRSVAADRLTLHLEAALAKTTGLEAALVGPSTLHLMCDLLATLAGRTGTVLVEAGAYGISKLAAERCRGRGARVLTYRGALKDALRRSGGRRPVVVMDSMSPGGVPTPVGETLELCARIGGTLILDDSQGFGLLGTSRPGHCYGSGGGGTLAHLGRARGAPVVVVASLSKSFGVPLAFAAGGQRVIKRLRVRGDTSWSSSPPDLVSVQAALRSLEINRTVGDRLRATLAESVDLLGCGAGLEGEAAFPIRGWRLPSPRRAMQCHAALAAAGVRALLDAHVGAVRFVVTAAHTGPVLARALHTLRAVRERYH